MKGSVQTQQNFGDFLGGREKRLLTATFRGINGSFHSRRRMKEIKNPVKNHDQKVIRLVEKNVEVRPHKRVPKIGKRYIKKWENRKFWGEERCWLNTGWTQ